MSRVNKKSIDKEAMRSFSIMFIIIIILLLILLAVGFAVIFNPTIIDQVKASIYNLFN